MENNAIEIRSKNLQNFIGEIPPRLVCIGNIIILFIIAILFLVVRTVHYPYNIECNGVVRTYDNTPSSRGTATLYIPYKYLYLFEEPHKADITLEGAPDCAVEGTIMDIRKIPVKLKGGNYFVALVEIKSPLCIHGVINCTATVLIENKTLLELVFH